MYMFVCLFVLLPISCVVPQKYLQEIISKSKVELTPYLISCLLKDLVIISAPDFNNAKYYLQTPQGETKKQNIHNKNTKQAHSFNKLYLNNEVIETYESNYNYRRLNVTANESIDVIGGKEIEIGKNEFLIGPLSEEDHGNWVLSVYLKDLDDDWIEMFQVISIEIVESIPILPANPVLKPGNTLQISFINPIPDLEMCQLTPPNTTFDRYYDRNRFEMDKCGYTVTNLTVEDEGTWKIIGVGQIVYEGEIFLKIDNT